MVADLSKARIFLRPGITDMRKAVNGLTAIVQEEMQGDPFSGSVYLFWSEESAESGLVGQQRFLVKPETA